jgi:gliding motility-associated lipoprotein GldH
MKLENRIVCIFIAITLVASACDSSRLYEQNIDFSNETWSRDSLLVFNVEISDTLSVYNIFLNNRITGQYEFSNLYLFVNTELPNNQRLTDTVECLLRNPSGKILGKGFGDVWSNKIPYRMHIRFPLSGNYKFTIEQAMRVENLEHILDAGIRIEKAKL